MQNYTEIADTTGITESRELLLNNTKTVMSNHSGPGAPVGNLQIGMTYYNTTDKKEYTLESTGPDVWVHTGAQVTTSATDTTAGRLLKVGDFGIGGIPATYISSDLNGIESGGTYYVYNNANAPLTGAGSVATLKVEAITGNDTNQIWTNRLGRRFFRSQNSSTWTAWQEIYHTGNAGTAVTEDITTSNTDNTAGRLLRVGDFGLGALSPNLNEASFDTMLPSKPNGWYVVSGTTDGPSGAVAHYGICFIQNRGGGDGVFVTYYARDSNQVAIRRYDSSAWQDWEEIWHTGNLVKTTSSTDATAGRLLKVGDAGILSNAISVTSNDFNNAANNGFYKNENSIDSINYPDVIASNRSPVTVLNAAYSGTYGWQLAAKTSGSSAEPTSSIGLALRTKINGGYSNWVEIYHTGNLLGTVTESAGVPTGAVIETGSNTNGRYTKFADGTMICVKTNFSITATASSVVSSTWTFPLGFAAQPSVSIGITAASSDWSDPTARVRLSLPFCNDGLSSSLVGGYFTGTETITVSNVKAIAIGRWF